MSNDSLSQYRIFIPHDKVGELSSSINVEESFAAFQVVTADGDSIAEVRQRYPVQEISTPSPPPTLSAVAGLSDEMAKPSRGPYTVAVRFRSLVRDEWRQFIQQADCTIYTSIGSTTVVASCPNKPALQKIQSADFVTSAEPYVPHIQLSPAFFEGLAFGSDEAAIEKAIQKLSQMDKPTDEDQVATNSSTVAPGVLIATFFGTDDQQLAIRRLKRQRIHRITVSGKHSLVIDLSTHPSPQEALIAIVERQGLRTLQEKTLDVFFNDIARHIVAGGSIIEPPAGLGLTGQGEVVAVADSGLDTGGCGHHPSRFSRTRAPPSKLSDCADMATAYRWI